MPQIPGVPTLEPVQKPMMSPQKASGTGETLSWFGGAMEGIALEGTAMQANIRNAQKQVDQITFQNQASALYDQMQVDLRKTTDSRAVPAVMDKYHDDLNGLVKQWDKSPAAPELGMHADALRPKMSVEAQLRQIDLMGKEFDASVTQQKEQLIPELVTARRNGDKQTEQAVRDHLKSTYDDAVRNALKSPAQVQQEMRIFDKAVQKEQNEAAILSPNPQERKAAIAQLTKGGSGPLDLSEYAQGDINATLEHAREADERLTRLGEAQNLNGALNVMTAAFSTPEYKDNYEAQEKALEDGDWLKAHNIVDEKGQPDRVMAEKLSQEVVRLRSYREKEQQDRDEKLVEEYSPRIDNHTLSEAAIDQIPGISVRARANLHRQWRTEERQSREEWRMERSQSLAERQDHERTAAYQSQQLAGEILLDINSGKVYEASDIRTMDGLTKADKAALIQDVQKDGVPSNPYVRDGLQKIREIDMQPHLQYELARIFVSQVKQGDLRGQSITQALEPMLKKAKSKECSDWIQRTFQSLDPNFRVGAPAYEPYDPTKTLMQNLRRPSATGITPQSTTNAEPTRPANVPEGYEFKDGPKGRGWYKPKGGK